MLDEATEYGKTLLGTADKATLEGTFESIPDSTAFGKEVLLETSKDTLQDTLEVEQQRNKNVIINGNFDIWQRGISQTSSGYGSDDRWTNGNSISTKVHTQETFLLGQTDVPNNPKYYSRTVVTSVAGVGNFSTKYTRIEDVSTLAGQTVTLSFWAKSDTPKNIATEYIQDFGTGGTPSTRIDSLNVTTFNLTTAWQKFTLTATIPSVSGKTIGSNANDYLGISFWFDAGSNFDSRTNTLGQQSGTFDIAQVQLEKGSIATEFERRTTGQELSLCQRYYQEGEASIAQNYSYNGGGQINSGTNYFKVSMRTVPTMVKGANLESVTAGTATIYNPTVDSFILRATPTVSNCAAFTRDEFTADAEL